MLAISPGLQVAIMDLITSLGAPVLLAGGTIAIGAGMVGGYAGFGGGLILIPLLAHLYGPVEAVAITILSLTAMAVTLVPAATKLSHWRETTPMIVAGTTTAVLGSTFFVAADPIIIKRGMGIFVTIAALVLMTGWSYRGAHNAVRGSFVGAVSGGIFGAFGVPAGWMNALYFMSASTTPAVQRANIIVTNMSVTVLYLGALLFAGVYDSAVLLKTAIVVPLFMVGVTIGKHLFTKLPSVWFKRVALGLLLTTGLVMLSRW
jgi:uncharacterized membrane protein YfcA